MEAENLQNKYLKEFKTLFKNACEKREFRKKTVNWKKLSVYEKVDFAKKYYDKYFDKAFKAEQKYLTLVKKVIADQVRG